MALGHEVTLFASGDSVTSATLRPVWPRSLRLDGSVRDPSALHALALEVVRQQAHDFDVLHFHLDYHPFSLFSRQTTPFVTTLHGRLDLPEHQPVFRAFSSIPVVSISNAQRKPLPQANWVRTIHHGLPASSLVPVPRPPSYLAALGRISPEKGFDRAIRIAERCGMPLKIAAKVDKVDEVYFDDRHQAASSFAAGRIRGRDIGRAKSPSFSAVRFALLVPGRLAGAVRPGDDRGDGVRHARDRLRSRLDPRGDRGGRDRLRRATTRRARSPPSKSCRA